ncbi:hypothetical protein WDU94_004265 [Cyamophila willieti]
MFLVNPIVSTDKFRSSSKMFLVNPIVSTDKFRSSSKMFLVNPIVSTDKFRSSSKMFLVNPIVSTDKFRSSSKMFLVNPLSSTFYFIVCEEGVYPVSRVSQGWRARETGTGLGVSFPFTIPFLPFALELGAQTLPSKM